jgi:hypothetical protein
MRAELVGARCGCRPDLHGTQSSNESDDQTAILVRCRRQIIDDFSDPGGVPESLTTGPAGFKRLVELFEGFVCGGEEHFHSIQL